MRSAALRESCGVVRGLVFGREQGVPSPRNQGEGHGSGAEPGSSREELPGVWGAERIDSDGGNWGGPPRPGGLRFLLPERGVL